MRVVNIPHAGNKRTQLQVDLAHQTVNINVVDTETPPPFNATSVCDLYIGEHMFEPSMRDRLRGMVGEAIISVIEQARDAGYRQAQEDIRRALGI